MKRLILLCLIFANSILSFSQTQVVTTANGKKVVLYPDGTWKYQEVKKDSANKTTSSENIRILVAKDKMTDKTYYKLTKYLTFQKGEKTLIIKPTIDNKKYSGISIYFDNIGSCNENNTLIFLFEDSTKFELQSWNEFNCKGYSYFDLYGKAFSKLQKKVISIQFQNGRTYNTFTVDLDNSDQDYFMKVKEVIDSGITYPAHLEDNKIVED